MAQLWNHAAAGWLALPLTGELLLLTADEKATARIAPAADSVGGKIVLRRVIADARESWLLFATPGSGIWVNGNRVCSGLRVLRDKDELRLPGRDPVFFSTEQLAAIAPFPGTERPAYCPRCRQILAVSDPAVRCPGCGTWHHQSSACSCWTYAPTCALCTHATPLDADFQWRPEEDQI